MPNDKPGVDESTPIDNQVLIDRAIERLNELSDGPEGGSVIGVEIVAANDQNPGLEEMILAQGIGAMVKVRRGGTSRMASVILPLFAKTDDDDPVELDVSEVTDNAVVDGAPHSDHGPIPDPPLTVEDVPEDDVVYRRLYESIGTEADTRIVWAVLFNDGAAVHVLADAFSRLDGDWVVFYDELDGERGQTVCAVNAWAVLAVQEAGTLMAPGSLDPGNVEAARALDTSWRRPWVPGQATRGNE